MRLVIAAVLTIAIACGSHVDETSQAAAGSPSATAVAAPRAARATTPATKDCTVSWVQHYHSVAARSGVRARGARGRDRAGHRAAASGIRTSRDPRRPANDVRGPQSGDHQGRSPNRGAGARRRVPEFDGRRRRNEHWVSLGGPQGQFRFRGGVVSGPFYVFANAVHAQEGSSLADVIAAVR